MDAATQTPVAPNAPTEEDYLRDAEELGRQAGTGKDTQIKFALKCVEGGYLGKLSSDETRCPDKKGSHFKMAERYAKAQGIATVFDAKPSNQRKLMSNAKTFMDFGTIPKWGAGQPLQVVNELLTIRQNKKKANESGLMDPNNMLLAFIRIQRKRDDILEGDELKAFCYKNGTKPTSAERVLEGIRKTASRLMQGKVSNCPDSDDSAEVKAIVQACTKRLTAIAKDKGAALKQAKAAGKVPA